MRFLPRLYIMMAGEELKSRTKKFALRVIKLYISLPRTNESQVLGRQVLRSGTSVGAHYHEAQRAKSDADFISKIEGGLQELEETSYWLDLLKESGIAAQHQIVEPIGETEQLMAIFVSIVKSVKDRHR
jgi:four helix bundle protein